MTNITASATAGLRANEARVAVAASNVANAGSKDYKAQQYSQTVDESGNPVPVVNNRDPATLTVVNAQGQLEILPNVSLDEEVINAQLAVYDFKANANVLKTQQDLTKKLIDIFA